MKCEPRELYTAHQPRPLMKILYLNPTGLFGGAERTLLDVLASVKIAEPDWTLALVTGGDGPLVERARALGIATTVLALPESLERIGDAGAGGPAGWQFTRLAMLRAMAGAACAVPPYTRRLSRKIDEISPDVVHTNGFKMHILGVWATRRKRPVVWHIHDYVSMRPVMAKLVRHEAHRCAAAITNSDSVRDDLRSICGDGLDVFTVYNAVNLTEFNPSGHVADLDALAGLARAPSRTIRIGLVATMAMWKGHEVFLRAMASLPGEAPVRAYVIGDAVYHTDGSQVSLDRLRAKGQALGLGDRVGFTGFVEDVAAAMRALDIVVHASTVPEPFGLVIAEAMASGKPVIASRAGGAAEIVEVAGGALSHRPGDSAELADLIMRLVRDPGERACLGCAGRASAERLFARPRLAQELIPIYNRVASVRS
jgi:glycosyltransferase involved in cell wall biosynthesis